MGRGGLIVVSGYLGGANAGWSIAFVHNDTLRIVFNRPSNVFDILIPLVKADGSIAALSSYDYEFSDLTPSGRQTRRFTRLNPPRFALDPTERAALLRYLESSPASRRPEYAPPVYIPAVAHAYARSTGTFLVAVAAGGAWADVAADARTAESFAAPVSLLAVEHAAAVTSTMP